MIWFLTLLAIVGLNWNLQVSLPSLQPVSQAVLLASHQFSLKERYKNKFVNDVFKDNILLTMKYMEKGKALEKPIRWKEVEKPFLYSFRLKKGETFAFHEQVLSEYQSKNIKLTTNAHFNAQDGFRSDGYLFGDGVCHLASLLYWVAKEAGLSVEAPTNHNFAVIPQVPKEYGVSIYYQPNVRENSASQNLYITNNRSNDVIFRFDYDGNNLMINVSELQTHKYYLL